MTPVDGLDLPALLDVAGGILDEAAPAFVDGLGAPSAVAKGGTDFATQVDLDLERRIGGELAERTGLPVHGEEFGGPSVTEGVVWVLDPIDGTFNYSSGMPLTGILLALLADGEPLLGLTWLPLLDRRYAAAATGPLRVNGRPAPLLADVPPAEAAIAVGPFNIAHGGRYPGARRAEVIGALSTRVGRLRMTGSTGIDMAYTAAGVFGGAIAFGRHPWDNAAGAALVRAAGGIATDLAGNPWTAASPSLVAGSPSVHAEIMAVIDDVIGDDWTATATADPDRQHPGERTPR